MGNAYPVHLADGDVVESDMENDLVALAEQKRALLRIPRR